MFVNEVFNKLSAGLVVGTGSSHKKNEELSSIHKNNEEETKVENGFAGFIRRSRSVWRLNNPVDYTLDICNQPHQKNLGLKRRTSSDPFSMILESANQYGEANIHQFLPGILYDQQFSLSSEDMRPGLERVREEWQNRASVNWT